MRAQDDRIVSHITKVCGEFSKELTDLAKKCVEARVDFNKTPVDVWAKNLVDSCSKSGS